MARAKRNSDPLAKRRDETDLQWRSRVARTQETRRQQGEDIITPERRAKGDLEEIGAKVSGQARSYRPRCTSSLTRLCARGVIDKDQLGAAQEVAMIVERIQREVGTASGGLAEQVDCSGSRYTHGEETLHRVCMERAYDKWRGLLPAPKRMVLDMVTHDNQLAAIARRHNTNWRKAIKVLRAALDEWPRCKSEAFDGITQEDVDASMQRVA